jgi:hypothetical protein
MFENVTQILPIVYLKERQNMKFIEELIAEDVIPIGCIIKNVKSYYQEKEIFEDLLPCIVYKENYRT